MGIRRHEQDVGGLRKWVFSFSAQRGYTLILIIYVIIENIKIEFSVCRLKINHAWSTPSYV
jgi:hypothetical protein